MTIPKAYAEITYNLGYLSLLSGLYGFYNGHSHIAFAPTLVGFTTFLYWKDPVYSWRRNLDLVVVIGGLLYQNYRVWNAEYRVAYYLTNALGFGCYPIGVVVYRWGYKELGMIFHMGIHVIANLANLILYLGRV